MTTVSGGSHGSVSTDGRTKDEAPLLTETGREFLDGKVDSEEYVDRARDLVAHKVRLEMYQSIVGSRRRLRRGIALGGLILAILGYALLGLTTSLSDKNYGSLAAVAFGTAAGMAIFVIAYGWHGGESLPDSLDSERTFRGMIDHFFYLFLSAEHTRNIRKDHDNS